MTCSGCSGAIERVLKKAEGESHSYSVSVGALRHVCEGVSSFDVSLEKQEVLVNGSIPYDDLLEKIKKTGKEVSTAGTSAGVRPSKADGCTQVRSGQTVA